MTMAALALKVRIKPHSLLNCLLKTRAFCSNPSGPAGSEPSVLIPGRKILETFSEEFEIGNRVVSIETGKIARFANGAVVIRMDDTNVLSTVASSKSDGSRDFLPLTVDYQEKQYAQGVIPTTFMRREGAPKERELLCGRLIDRSIRPLFPAGFYHEVQVMISVLSSDGRHDPDVMAANATSAALMLSDIPWAGPIAMIRVGRIDGKLVYAPTVDELSLSDLNLVYACTRDKTLMIEVQAREITENDLQSALKLAHAEAVKYLDPQIRLAEKAGKQKKEYKLSVVTDKIFKKIKRLSEKKIEAVFTDPTYGKFERGEALDNITQSVKAKLEEKKDADSLIVLPKAVDSVRKQVVRKRIIKKGLRVDGRKLDEVRPLYCEAGTYPTLHGSSIFSRGDTQVLCTVTLGAPGDAQRLDSIVGPPTKRFMLHYSFPPFSINEVGKRGGLNRREVGHGTLAEKALLAVLPPEDEFPYTVRINSEVMASDGSTSMATVCGGSMALMDAGISLKEHVAGVSVGLISDLDPSTGDIKEYRILTDILGLEDHLGDMDFKIAGTKKGITAIQLDIKPSGIPLDIICESLEPARKGRCQILDRMEQEIRTPRMTTDGHAPQLVTLKLSNEALRRLIGPLGTQRKKIEQETGARIAINDGIVTIVAKSRSILEQAQEKIYFLVGREIEVGEVYKGVIASIKEYGAFVELNGAQQGLLHISELSHDQVSKVSDVLSIGQELSLMCIENDIRGNIKLSLKATLPQPKTQKKNSKGSETIKESSISNNKHEDEDVDYTLSSMPSIVVRSAVECDAQDIASNSSKTTKTPFKTGSKTSRNSSSSKYSKELKVSNKTTQDHSSKDGLRTLLNFKENTGSDKKVSKVTDRNTQDNSLLKNMKRLEIIEEELSIGKNRYEDDDADYTLSNKYEDDDVDYTLSSMPSIVVRSAVECDAQEIASNSSKTTHTPFQTNSKNTRNSSSPKYLEESEGTYKTTQDRDSKGGIKTMLNAWDNRGFDKKVPEVADKNIQDNSRKDDFEGTSSFCILKDSDYSKTENVKSSGNSSFPKYSKGSKVINKTTQDNSSIGGLKSMLNLLTIGEVDKRAPEVNKIKEDCMRKVNLEDNSKTKKLNNCSNFNSTKRSKESNVSNKATQESIISKGVLDSMLNLLANKEIDIMEPEVKDGDRSKTKDVKNSSNYGSPKFSKDPKVDLGKMLNLLANKGADKKVLEVNEKITEDRSKKTDSAMFDLLGKDFAGHGKTKKVKATSNSSSFMSKKESNDTNNIMQDSGRRSHLGAMLNLFANKAENEISDEGKCRNKRTNAESLNLGDTVTAKVSQVRDRGLVLDAGGGLRGMYKFKENEERSFEVGKELKVMCSSFNSKGIPVFNLVED